MLKEFGFEKVTIGKKHPADTLEEGYDRVAIYSKGDRFTHITRQLPDGWWASKMGDEQDIEHQSLAVLQGFWWGKVAAVLRRSKLWQTEKNNAAQSTPAGAGIT